MKNIPTPELLLTVFFVITVFAVLLKDPSPKKKNRPTKVTYTKRTKTREKFITPLSEQD